MSVKVNVAIGRIPFGELHNGALFGFRKGSGIDAPFSVSKRIMVKVSDEWSSINEHLNDPKRWNQFFNAVATDANKLHMLPFIVEPTEEVCMLALEFDEV